MSRVLSFVFVGYTREYKGHALVRGRLCSGGGARPGLFASQRRGRAGQISEQRQRAAYLFDH
ncbi:MULTISPECIES: hypothetical protein [Paenibacillus]|uniref:Uncharacterized protein n=1 Tax=Paenibacillus peoriae TaxID=59893 RepID=A0ABU1QPA8_9BACL|nr:MULTISPECIES: hypothetical protein [Paenibacillus]MBP1174693.1 hypothetical protein [Paenibacillus sp. PvR133]MDR6780620.1 hypothetical protein [Paenibacillus peoriae]